MSYPDPASPPPPNRTPLYIGLAVLIAAILGIGGWLLLRNNDQVRDTVGGGVLAVTPRAMVSGEAVAAELARDPMSRDVVGAIREIYPEDWTSITNTLAERVRAGDTPDQLRRQGFELMRSFAASKGAATAAAPDAELRGVAETQLALARSLQAVNPGMCARFTFAGFSPDDMTAFPPASADELGRAIRAQLVASRAGTDRPATRPQPSPQDLQVFLRAYIEAGGDEGVLQRGGTISGDGTVECSSGIAIYQAVTALPPETGTRIIGYLIGQAAAAQAAAGGVPPSAGPAPDGPVPPKPS